MKIIFLVTFSLHISISHLHTFRARSIPRTKEFDQFRFVKRFLIRIFLSYEQWSYVKKKSFLTCTFSWHRTTNCFRTIWTYKVLKLCCLFSRDFGCFRTIWTYKVLKLWCLPKMNLMRFRTIWTYKVLKHRLGTLWNRISFRTIWTYKVLKPTRNGSPNPPLFQNHMNLQGSQTRLWGMLWSCEFQNHMNLQGSQTNKSEVIITHGFQNHMNLQGSQTCKN